MLAIDQSGNKLLEFVKISEEDAALQFPPITVCLIVVKDRQRLSYGIQSLAKRLGNIWWLPRER